MPIMKIRSLETKILILFIILLFVVQGVSFYSTYLASQELENTHLSNRIANAEDVSQTQFRNRHYYLSAFAETVAKDYGLKTVLNEDIRSVLVALNNHRERIQGDLALAIDQDGNVIAQLMTYDDKNQQKKVRVGKVSEREAVQANLELSGSGSQLISLNETLYQVGLSPIQNGARTIGWLGFGYLIDKSLANELAHLTGVEVAFISERGDTLTITSSSLSERYPSNSPFYKSLVFGTNSNFIHRQVTIGEIDDLPVTALLFASKADVLASVGNQWQRLFLVISLTLTLSVFGALFISKSITSPIRKLIVQVRNVTEGNYCENVVVQSSDELEKLSNDFNTMTKAIVLREETIKFQAFHDPLTHLPNRNALIDEIEILEKTHDDFVVIQLCFLNADEIADTLGYDIADKVIQHVANRISVSTFSDSKFHLGGENFVLIVRTNNIEPIISSLLAELNEHCQFNGVTLHLQFVAGLAIASLTLRTNFIELLQKANVAMHYAKKHKKHFQIYDPSFDANALERLYLMSHLKKAIDNNELVLFYQPKLDLKSMRIFGAEALVRWESPEKGLIPPDSFINIAEKTGQMAALTRWVTARAISQYEEWVTEGIVLNIAINISPENILDVTYCDYLLDLKLKHNLPDSVISLEITEEAIVEKPDIAIQQLTRLRESGFTISIDDYGTGYSSLGQLKLLPVQELKIDRSFVQRLASDESDKIIVNSTLELARNLRLSVVAEGVEDQATLQWLTDAKCDFAQGYFISKPLPHDEISTWLDGSPYAPSRL
ncbi:EAL domain-containing protein [Alteromonas oceanisediminis]|uniref:EAL domain-containing protein n=1 Tax=Alteromonas oceanisediminis TaxID=2836180 RepID=UPI001BDA39F6|nr:EAL domain-containing protein [Alteromonas oceanisediminis]MBT0587052.1 EAL domain-containing protein [Alteromonas oceanisediminis]